MADAEQKSSQPSVVTWLLEHATATITVMGLAVYGLVRFGIDAFYSELGVTAEEVGLTYPAILSRAILTFLSLLVITISSGGLLGYPLGRVLGRLLNKHSPSGPLLREMSVRSAIRAPMSRIQADQALPTSLVLYTVAVPAILYITNMAMGNPIDLIPRYSIVVLLILIGIPSLGLLYVLRARRPPKPPDKSRTYRAQDVMILASVITSVLIGGAFLLSWQSGSRQAERVMEGFPVSRPVPFLSSGALNIQAKCVGVTTLDHQVPPVVAPRTALYLGQSGGILVLYKVGVGPLRLPASRFSVQGIDPWQCTEP
jgi:hypothetical protein